MESYDAMDVHRKEPYEVNKTLHWPLILRHDTYDTYDTYDTFSKKGVYYYNY